MIQMETYAVNKVKDVIADTHTLSPYINENDKTPCWDGEIFIFNTDVKTNPYRTKENLIGRVSCQVKGVDNASVKKQKINYSMERATLENYFNDGGTILFVVRRQESKDPDGKAEFRIYYAELLPIKIQQLLESKSEQDKESKISIACNVFPEKRRDVEWTIKNFYAHKVRNSIFIGKSIDTKYSIENLSAKNNLQAIRVYRSFQKNFLEPRPNREEIIYGVTSICDVEQEIPLHLVESIVLSNQIEEKILINDCEYIMQVNVTDSNCQIVIRFGESFKTILNKETKKQTFRIDLKSQQALKDKIRDLKFIIAACSGNEVVVGGGAHKFIVKELESKQIEDFESQLSMLKKIQNLLDLLGVKNDLELGSVTGVEMKEMNRLYAYFLANEKIRLKTTPENDFEIKKIKIGNLKIILMACYLPEGEVKYLDFSKIEFDFYFGDNGAPIGKTSRYTIFDFNDFLEVSNFDYDLIYADMILFEDEENIVRSNRIVLEILKAYDICENEELLKLALKLSLFLLNRVAKESGAGTLNNFNADDFVMYKLNKYQIMKRLNVLSDNEIDDIEEMIQSGNLSTVAALACYTLLENQKASLRNFNRLSESEQGQFLEFPIGNLYKKITS